MSLNVCVWWEGEGDLWNQWSAVICSLFASLTQAKMLTVYLDCSTFWSYVVYPQQSIALTILHEFQCEITPYKNKLRKNWKTLLIHFEKVFVIYYSKRWFICIICRREKHMRLFESGGSLPKSDDELWNCWKLSMSADSTLY